MKGELKDNSKKFALRIVKMCQYLQDEKHERVMSKQVLRSGTSVGANIAEAEYAQSRDDFITKLTISLKEAGETVFWLELLRDADYITPQMAESMLSDGRSLISMLVASLNTLKGGKKNGN